MWGKIDLVVIVMVYTWPQLGLLSGFSRTTRQRVFSGSCCLPPHDTNEASSCDIYK